MVLGRQGGPKTWDAARAFRLSNRQLPGPLLLVLFYVKRINRSLKDDPAKSQNKCLLEIHFKKKKNPDTDIFNTLIPFCSNILLSMEDIWAQLNWYGIRYHFRLQNLSLFLSREHIQKI